jgi:hypothetical protein
MKRVLSVLALAAVIALAITVVSTASQRPGKSAGKSAHSASMTTAGSAADCPPGSCDDPSQCPGMSKSSGATASHADMSSGSCPASAASGCPSQCAPEAKGASNAVAVAEGGH